MRLSPLLLVPLLLLPVAQAATLSDLEEPVRGSDRIVPFTLTEHEAGLAHLIVFLNPASKPFGLVLYDHQGASVYEQNGTLGVQGMPRLEPGDYRFLIRGDGAFQVVNRTLDRPAGANTSVQETLTGEVDAYLFVPQSGWSVDLTGDVEVEVRDLTKPAVKHTPPANFTAQPPFPLVLTVRGAPGAAYGITMTPRALEEDAGESETPGAGAALALLATGAALAVRRRRA